MQPRCRAAVGVLLVGVLVAFPQAALAHRLLSDSTALTARQPAPVTDTASGDLTPIAGSDKAPGALSLVPGAAYRVVNGATPRKQRFKYQLGFRPRTSNGGSSMCGASLIRADVALTAAHCLPSSIDAAAVDEMRIYAGGIINWLSPDTDATEYRVRGAVRHPAYSPKNSRNDIALVFLDQCVALGPAVQPIKIATPEEFAAAKGSTWMVSGWGTTDYGADPTLGQDGALPKLLQFAHVKYVQPSVCESALSEAGGPRFGSSVFDENTAMCAGMVTGAAPTDASVPMQDACQGDSGGPLVFNKGNAATPENGSPLDDRLVGVVSWGIGCGKYGAPSVYTQVPAFRKWIAGTLAANPADCGSGGAGAVGAGGAPADDGGQVAGADGAASPDGASSGDAAGPADGSGQSSDGDASGDAGGGDATSDSSQQSGADDPALAGIDNWFDFIASILNGGLPAANNQTAGAGARPAVPGAPSAGFGAGASGLQAPGYSGLPGGGQPVAASAADGRAGSLVAAIAAAAGLAAVLL